MNQRTAGVLLHPTSLPGPYGVGDLGPGARRFLAWLESARQHVWQVLPLGPVDDTGCPYTSPSAVARSPLLLSPDDLLEEGWLRIQEKPYAGGIDQVDWPLVHHVRTPLNHLVAQRVVEAGVDLEAWASAHPWVREWSLFAALVDAHAGQRWLRWSEPLRHRDADALARAREEHHDAIQRHVALQWLLDQQWRRLADEAHRRGISIWGDVPFYVAGDSCDTWVHRGLFRMDADGHQAVVAGVPPDAFSATGQRWGNPLYDEGAMHAQGYAWWVERFQTLLEWVDCARIDHFRGLAACWEVPGDAPDATSGRWVPGPGEDLFTALRQAMGPELPLVAEDLGVITPDVEALRDDQGLMGMAILQFAFGPKASVGAHAYLPHNHREPLVVYTGTHDNDTVRGWYESTDEGTRDRLRRYLAVSGDDVSWDVLRMAHNSVARVAIAPMQDLLSLGGNARMNTPGTVHGNWAWRVRAEGLDPRVAARLADLTTRAGRA